MKQNRRTFLDELIGKRNAKEKIEDIAEAADALDEANVERKAKKEEETEKQDPLVPAEVVAEAIIKALSDAGVELTEDAVKLVISTAMEAAASIEAAAPEPVAEIVEEEVVPAPAEEMQADEEEPMPPTEPEDEEDKERELTEKALKGFADMITDVKDIGLNQVELSDNVKSLAEIVKEALDRLGNLEEKYNMAPMQASQAEETEIKNPSRNLKKQAKSAIEGSQAKFLDIPLKE